MFTIGMKLPGEGLHELLPLDKPVLLTVLAPMVIRVIHLCIRRLQRAINNGPQTAVPNPF